MVKESDDTRSVKKISVEEEAIRRDAAMKAIEALMAGELIPYL